MLKRSILGRQWLHEVKPRMKLKKKLSRILKVSVTREKQVEDVTGDGGDGVAACGTTRRLQPTQLAII